jgi:negative regulator of genetic competence, sporulation and motility
MSNYATAITMLEDLPDINELESNKRNENGDDKMAKYIRNNQKAMDPNAGMQLYNREPMMQQQNIQHHQVHVPQPQMQVEYQERYEPIMHCLDIANHVSSCPICTKFYHNDKTLYLFVIACLAIVCLLLLKRVLNV